MKFSAFFKKKTVIGAIIIILVTGGYIWHHASSAKKVITQYVTGQVSKGTITISVEGTGQVAASNQVDIKPQGSGAITSLKVQAGQNVKAGQVIATLDSAGASNQVRQARASLQVAQANYDKVIAGAVGTDITLARLAVDSAQKNLDNAKKNYDTTVIQQQQAVDKAHTTFLNSDLEARANDTTSTATVTLSGQYTGKTEGTYNIRLYGTSGGISYSSNGLGNQSGGATRGFSVPIGQGLYITFSTTGNLDPSSTWVVEVPNSRSSNYISNQYAYTSAQQAQTQAITNAQNTIDSTTASLTQAQTQLEAKLAPASNADIANSKAQVASAEAQLSTAEQAYANTVVTAPFEGVIAKLSAQVGDQGGSGTAIATLITHQKVAQITLNEVDAAKIKVGQKATLTFDAIDGLSITGNVGEIDTIGTVTQNVVSYSTKIVFDTQDDRVKPGMSVSAAIITDVKQDVLLVPNSAVKTQGNESYIETLNNGAPEQHTVQTGLVNDSDTEVSGDVKEGDEIITQTITTGGATATPTTQRSVLQGLGGGGGAGGSGARTFNAGAGR